MGQGEIWIALEYKITRIFSDQNQSINQSSVGGFKIIKPSDFIKKNVFICIYLKLCFIEYTYRYRSSVNSKCSRLKQY